MVRNAIRASEITICVDGPGADDSYCYTIADADWGDIESVMGTEPDSEYPSPNMPLRGFWAYWAWDAGQFSPGDYEVSFEWTMTRPIIVWWTGLKTGHPVRWDSFSMQNTFVLHVD